MAVLMTLAWPAFGADPPAASTNTFALAWVRDDGAEGCPAGRDFADEVAHRLGRSPFDARAPRSIEIHVERDATEFRSRVFVREQDGGVTGRRVLASPDCRALFSATALAVALVIDPDVALREDATATQSVARFELPEPPRLPTSSAPAGVTSPTPTPSTPDRPAASQPARGRPDRASAALNAALTVGLLPESTPGVELRVRARPLAHWQFSAGALYATPGTATTDAASFGVSLTAFSLSALLDLVDTPALGVGVEAGAWAGALHVAVRPSSAASTVTPTRPGDFPWFAASAGLSLEVRPTRTWFFDAAALGVASLMRRELEITTEGGDAAAVWTQPVVGGLFSAGFGANFL